jgi:hypothetical protein
MHRWMCLCYVLLHVYIHCIWFETIVLFDKYNIIANPNILIYTHHYCHINIIRYETILTNTNINSKILRLHINTLYYQEHKQGENAITYLQANETYTSIQGKIKDILSPTHQI